MSGNTRRVVQKGTPYRDPNAPFLGKGSNSRVTDKERFNANWDLIFGKKDKPE